MTDYFQKELNIKFSNHQSFLFLIQNLFLLAMVMGLGLRLWVQKNETYSIKSIFYMVIQINTS
ncbi:MAG: hypothetical protein CM15mP102_19370 [Flavobacteriales bacterium]|nr:MAG: hypothetical protein CM15mP102_19370 [Flavobacteriales bacterium]